MRAMQLRKQRCMIEIEYDVSSYNNIIPKTKINYSIGLTELLTTISNWQNNCPLEIKDIQWSDLDLLISCLHNSQLVLPTVFFSPLFCKLMLHRSTQKGVKDVHTLFFASCFKQNERVFLSLLVRGECIWKRHLFISFVYMSILRKNAG